MAPATFFSLPPEIRLDIYDLLLQSPCGETISIRTEDPADYEKRKPLRRARTTYRIMSGRFRASSIETTYGLLTPCNISPAILRVNRQMHCEAVAVLYGSHVFDFGKDAEGVIPFLSDLTPAARASIKRVKLVQRALPYIKDFDRCEWRNLCAYLSSHLELTHLDLDILGGVPAGRWVAQDAYEKTDFTAISRFEGMEWVRQLAAIKGLRTLDVKAHLEHCPPPQSNAMAFFVNFSASIEKGFADYLKEVMVVASA